MSLRIEYDSCVQDWLIQEDGMRWGTELNR